MRWVVALVGAVIGIYTLVRQESVQFPETVPYGGAQLAEANTWSRGGLSGAVYVPPGDALPDASLQVGLIVSTEHPTGDRLLTWIREQSRASGTMRYHDSGTTSESCVVGVNEPQTRTYMALQLCKTAGRGAACIESDRVLDGDLFASCLNNTGCFNAECNRRWGNERTDLDAVLTAIVLTR
jgi:hypothetical protein